jgi:hypothetical protein
LIYVQLLGFPIQLVGLATCPLLVVRWFMNGQDWFEDVSAATVGPQLMPNTCAE